MSLADKAVIRSLDFLKLGFRLSPHPVSGASREQAVWMVLQSELFVGLGGGGGGGGYRYVMRDGGSTARSMLIDRPNPPV